MTPEEFSNALMRAIPSIKEYAAQEFPRRALKIGIDHFQNNFRKGGFVNGGLHPWPKAKRQTGGKYALNNYGTLLSARNELFNSIGGITRSGQAVIRVDKEYAQIHNDGGTINHPGGTAYFSKSGRAVFVKNETAARYQSLHLKPMKRTAPHKITIPKRQFIGESIELNDALSAQVEKDFLRILNFD
jgi:phage gpG-like protein